MGTTFEERRRATLVAAGVGSPEDVLRLCQRAGKTLTLELVERVLDDPENCLYRDVMDVCEALKVRAGWLVRGNGVMMPPRMRSPDESEVIRLLGKMPDRKAHRWVNIGKGMANGRD